MRRVLIGLACAACGVILAVLDWQLEIRGRVRAPVAAEANPPASCREGYTLVRLVVEPRGSGYDRVCIHGYRP